MVMTPDRFDPSRCQVRRGWQSQLVLSCFAQIVRSTVMVDRAFNFFNRLRSRIVLTCAPDAFYDVYNDLTYSRQLMYRPESKAFSSSLFAFEERTITRDFPPPPGKVLIGAAGGGREAFALARRGYQVVAFEPARSVAVSMARACHDSQIETLVGRYEDLPFVGSLAQPSSVLDLRSRAPFDAAILGWVSFSLLRSDERCIKTLRQIGDLTIGPILVSAHPGLRRSVGFSVHMGYYRGLTSADIGALAERAGLTVDYLDDTDNWPYAVLRAAPTCATTTSAPS
jgi:hypothetical protein